MRLGDITRPGRDDGEIPAEVERELAALDAALRGEELPAEMEDLAALVSDLRAEREEPEPRFEAELDAWAAAGFPRGERPGARAANGGAGGRSGGFFSRFGPTGPRGWLPIAATTATVVVIGVSIAQVDFGGEGTMSIQGESGGGTAADVETSAEPAAPADEPSGEISGGGSLEESLGDLEAAEDGASALERDQSAGFSEDGRGASESGDLALTGPRPGVNRGQENRRVERDAEMTLAAPADEVADVADGVIEVVENADGVVLNSRVTGTDESARAELELKVPAAALDETLAELSDLANVVSRTEALEDITGKFVSAKDRLVGLRAERKNLATRIREATTDAELETLKAQLSAVNRQIADARSELNEVRTRAQLADVTVVVTSEGAGSGDDGWSFGDALKDAGRVLEVAAGVALISAAVLVPLAIIAAIAYVAVAAINRRAREKALDE